MADLKSKAWFLLTDVRIKITFRDFWASLICLDVSVELIWLKLNPP